MSAIEHSYEPKGVCATKITFTLDNAAIGNVKFHGGCPGNAIGLASVLEGMTVEEAKRRLRGIPCGSNATSCPDQFVKALESIEAL